MKNHQIAADEFADYVGNLLLAGSSDKRLEFICAPFTEVHCYMVSVKANGKYQPRRSFPLGESGFNEAIAFYNSL